MAEGDIIQVMDRAMPAEAVEVWWGPVRLAGVKSISWGDEREKASIQGMSPDDEGVAYGRKSKTLTIEINAWALRLISEPLELAGYDLTDIAPVPGMIRFKDIEEAPPIGGLTPYRVGDGLGWVKKFGDISVTKVSGKVAGGDNDGMPVTLEFHVMSSTGI